MKTANHRYPGESKFKGWLYLLPAFLIYFIFTFIPILETFRSSFLIGMAFLPKELYWHSKLRQPLFRSAFLKAISNNLVFIIFTASSRFNRFIFVGNFDRN